MTDFWRRQAIQSELVRGRVFRRADEFFGEVDPGRVVDSAVFECGPMDPRSSPVHRPVRLHIQARVDVIVRSLRHPVPGSELQELLWDDLIALGARGGHQGKFYFWVQIYSDSDERITEADGASRVENISQDSEGPLVGREENRFSWAGRSWSVDNDQIDSARYPLAHATAGAPNCETMYDSPSSAPAIRGYLEQHPTTLEVSKTTQFQTFLYEMPLLAAERASTLLPGVNPTASVAWSVDDTLGRESAGGDIDVRERRYRVHYIHPNGMAPSGMQSVLWRVFHGR